MSHYWEIRIDLFQTTTQGKASAVVNAQVGEEQVAAAEGSFPGFLSEANTSSFWMRIDSIVKTPRKEIRKGNTFSVNVMQLCLKHMLLTICCIQPVCLSCALSTLLFLGAPLGAFLLRKCWMWNWFGGILS